MVMRTIFARIYLRLIIGINHCMQIILFISFFSFCNSSSELNQVVDFLDKLDKWCRTFVPK